MSKTRREFLGSAAAAAVAGGAGLAGLAGGCPHALAQRRPRKPAKPALTPALKGDVKREIGALPSHVPMQDTLTGIRRVKAPEAEMVVVAGNEAENMASLGMKAMGGMSHFVRKGDRVVITPNFAWATTPGAAATTSPELVRRVIALCKEAGASSITCLDYASATTPRAFRINGAYDAVKGTGATLMSPSSPEQYVRVDDFLKLPLHAKKVGWQAVPSALLRCDVLIDMPVFKHHREVKITGALKKLMGCVWRRATYHSVDLEGCIAELASVLRPTLTIMDGSRILTSNGPNGPGKVERIDRVLVSVDPVLADAYACRWLNVEEKQVAHLVQAAKLGVGTLDVKSAAIENVKL